MIDLTLKTIPECHILLKPFKILQPKSQNSDINSLPQQPLDILLKPSPILNTFGKVLYTGHGYVMLSLKIRDITSIKIPVLLKILRVHVKNIQEFTYPNETLNVPNMKSHIYSDTRTVSRLLSLRYFTSCKLTSCSSSLETMDKFEIGRYTPSLHNLKYYALTTCLTVPQ